MWLNIIGIRRTGFGYILATTLPVDVTLFKDIDNLSAVDELKRCPIVINSKSFWPSPCERDTFEMDAKRPDSVKVSTEDKKISPSDSALLLSLSKYNDNFEMPVFSALKTHLVIKIERSRLTFENQHQYQSYKPNIIHSSH